MHVLPHSLAPTLNQVTTDPRLCWSLLNTPGQVWAVSCGVTVPFSWVLVLTKFCCALQESISQSCVSSRSSVVGLMATSSKRVYAIPKSAAPRAPALKQPTAEPYLHRRHSNTVLSLWGSLGPGAHKVCLSPLSVSGGYGV